MGKEQKQHIRKRILNLLNKQEEDNRRKKSLVILEKLFAMTEFQKANLIMFYASFKGEVETFEMMKRAQQLGKRIAVPVILSQEKKIIPTMVDNLEEMVEGPYGIKQPSKESETVSMRDIDMVVVPGVAFDYKKNRLGRGAGYYDRFLSDLDSHIPTVGLAFDFQIMEALPCQDSDVSVSHVIVN